MEGTGITVNMVNPGPIERQGLTSNERERLSSISPARRMARSSDIVREVIRIIKTDTNGTISTVL
jgi:short-subunit dehydrogenase